MKYIYQGLVPHWEAEPSTALKWNALYSGQTRPRAFVRIGVVNMGGVIWVEYDCQKKESRVRVRASPTTVPQRPAGIITRGMEVRCWRRSERI